MQKLILTSSVHAVAKDCTQHLDMSKNKLAFIYTAAEVEKEGLDAGWMQKDRSALVDAGFDVFDYTLSGKDQTQIEVDLKNADILYFSGGNTFYLLQQSLQSEAIAVIRRMITKEDKVYIGTSAGSIIAGPKVHKYLLDLGEELIDESLLDAQGYGLVSFTVLPHWGSEGFKKRYLSSNFGSLYNLDQVPLLLLTDTQYIVVEGDSFLVRSVKESI